MVLSTSESGQGLISLPSKFTPSSSIMKMATIRKFSTLLALTNQTCPSPIPIVGRKVVHHALPTSKQKSQPPEYRCVGCSDLTFEACLQAHLCRVELWRAGARCRSKESTSVSSRDGRVPRRSVRNRRSEFAWRGPASDPSSSEGWGAVGGVPRHQEALGCPPRRHPGRPPMGAARLPTPPPRRGGVPWEVFPDTKRRWDVLPGVTRAGRLWARPGCRPLLPKPSGLGGVGTGVPWEGFPDAMRRLDIPSRASSGLAACRPNAGWT